MKTHLSIGLLLCLSVLPIRADTSNITYEVHWPAIHLDGTFTLSVGSAFGTYNATSALGTYGGLNGTFNTVWTGVRLSVQPDFEELDFTWDSVFTGYAVSPPYVGRASPWTSASDAWNDLITKGATDGVFITVVPEPSSWMILGIGLLSLVLVRSRSNRAAPKAIAGGRGGSPWVD
jgi:hypothetical protein